MRDIAFFSKLLALKKPWRVERVSLDTHEHQIDVWLAHRRNAVQGQGNRSKFREF